MDMNIRKVPDDIAKKLKGYALAEGCTLREVVLAMFGREIQWREGMAAKASAILLEKFPQVQPGKPRQKPMPPAKRLPDGPDGEHRFDRSNQPPLLDSTIKASPLLPKIEAKSKVVIHDGGASLYVQTPAKVMDRVQGLSRQHDRKTCRIYKCGMCAASKG